MSTSANPDVVEPSETDNNAIPEPEMIPANAMGWTEPGPDSKEEEPDADSSKEAAGYDGALASEEVQGKDP